MLAFLLTLAESPEQRDLVTELYNEYRPALKSMALKMLRNAEMAEDAVSNTFVSVIENIRCVTDVENSRIRAYLYTVVRNECRKILKIESRIATARAEECCEDIPCGKDVLDTVYLRELYRQLRALPPCYRDALYLKFGCGMKYTEIAELQDVSVSTVKKRVHTAREMLIKEVREYESV